jgi:hypothetical protein
MNVSPARPSSLSLTNQSNIAGMKKSKSDIVIGAKLDPAGDMKSALAAVKHLDTISPLRVLHVF